MNQKELWENKWKELADANKVAPPYLIWEKIEANLPSQHKNRIPIWWISSLSLVMIGVATYLFANTNGLDGNSNIVEKNHASRGSSHSLISEEQKAIPVHNSKLIIQEADRNKLANQDSPVDADIVNNIQDKPSNAAVQANVNQKKLDEPAFHSEISNAKTSLKSKGDLTGSPSTDDIYSQSNSILHNSKNTISDKSFAQESRIVNTSVESEISYLPIIDPILVYPESVVHIPSSPKINASGDCPDFQPNDNLHFFVSADAGVGFPIKELNVKVDQKQLLENRKETETPLVSWTANIYGGIKWKRHYSLSTGLQFNQIIEKFSYQRPGLIIITIRPGIDTTVEKRNYYRQAAITYTNLDVPLLFSYDWGRKNWEYSFELGPIFNFHLQTKGLMLVSDDDIRDLASSSDMYKKKLGLGWQAGVSFHKLLNNNLSVYIKPVYRSYFNDWSATTNPLSFSMQNVQCVLGLRKAF